MCTVTYIPGKDRMILTSNRDVPKSRSSELIETIKNKEQTILFPKDALAGGTWIATNNKGRLICLLNGAFVNHIMKDSYRISRGKMVLDFFDYENTKAFAKHYNFDGIEPFTLVIIENKQLYEIKWDEKKVHVKELETQKAHIWSSATLFEPTMKSKRELWFNNWLNKNIDHAAEITNFHLTAGEGNPRYDLLMNIGDLVQTVSMTHVQVGKNKTTIDFNELVHGSKQHLELELV